MHLRVADEFYRRPLGRYRSQGTYTGEAFREDILIKKLKELQSSEKIIIDFSDVTMTGSSFLEEAFGGLVRKHGYSSYQLENILVLEFPKRPYLERKVWEYIQDAEKELNR